MASLTWLDSSLRRSASLGQEVLERATRRAVDWNNVGVALASSTPGGADWTKGVSMKTHARLGVFAAVAGSMAQVTSQCERFYESGCCSEPSDTDRRHLSRFHPAPVSGKITPATAPGNKNGLSPDEDFDIRVPPGTYAVTAGVADSEQQTLLVNLKAGESFKLTFNF
ncbi:A-kinase-interacting protein 1 [Takifugu rubripes]|uniref:A-kinase-interacting protein 1 n=1 Tax=Takifugu flavidus TaxID=433684 RepID=A0A5C6PCY0_9TELE|nr:A-kinase-interacting protein 1 [Takifugu rubripes]XP_029697398.1 A-kinase-interacting protein 1 [Takifugu rubripes]XP_056908186.1 A-kinase-interacting protein 1 [Takifugu flavidus]TWW76077.1 hypothetical protein D4764_13G0007390 [Takifugu flavidus]|eukprot:XP_003967827.1 PREDICTED: A-kinase-interacting protein 1 [Takifugu rubripes]